MRHDYDHTCCCPDCVETERRLRAQAEHDKARGQADELRRYREAAGGYELRLQLVEVTR